MAVIYAVTAGEYSDGNQYRIEIMEDEYEALKSVSSYQQMSLIVDIWNRMNKKTKASRIRHGCRSRTIEKILKERPSTNKFIFLRRRLL